MRVFVLVLAVFSGLICRAQVELSVQTGHTSAIKKVVFSPDNKWILSSDADNTLVIWDVAQGKQYNSIQNKAEHISDVIFLSDSIFAVSYKESLIRLYSLTTGKTTHEYKTEAETGGLSLLKNSQRLFFGSTRLCSINLSDGKIEKYSPASNGIFSVVKTNDQGSLLVAGGKDDGFFYIINLANNAPQSIQRKFPGYLSAADFSADGKIVVSTTDGKIKSLNPLQENADGTTTDFPTNPFNDVKVSSAYIFGASGESGIHVFSESNWYQLPSLVDHTGAVNSLALSNDKQLLAAAGADCKITLWDVNKQQLLKTIKGNVNRINSISFTADGNSILIGYADGSFRVSDLVSNSSKASHIEASKVSKSLGWSYSVSKITAEKNDSVCLSFYYLHKTPRQATEAYNSIKVYDAVWKTRNGNDLNMTETTKQIPSVSNYISKLKKNESPLPHSIFPDSSCIAVSNKSGIVATVNGNSVTVQEKNTGKILYTINAQHNDRISAVAINDQYDMLATASWDGLIKLRDLKTGNLLVTYGAFGESDYIYLDKNNNYFASKGSLNYIAFRYMGRVFPFDQFDLKFNRPDIVLENLPFIQKEQTENFKKAFAKRLSKMKLTEKDLVLSTELPEISAILPDKLISKDGVFTFKIKAEDTKSELSSVSVFVNGVPEYGREGKKINGKNFEGEIKLELNPGQNTIQVFVTNAKGQSSLKETFGAFNMLPKRKPDLYLVLIGVSEYDQSQYNLKFAAKDAADVEKYMKKSKSFGLVNTKLILDKDAYVENIKNISDFLAPAKTDDVVLILLAGHGVLDKNLDYYLASSNMDFAKPEEKGISFETLDLLLSNTKCRNRILFLDACHSGEVDKEEVKVVENNKSDENNITFRSGDNGLSNIDKFNSFELAKSVFADFRANNGAWVISSAGATEYAIEGGQWKNGVFTYALLKGLSTGAADLNKDKRIMISELQKYITKEVVESTKGKQKPNVRNENLFNDIRIK